MPAFNRISFQSLSFRCLLMFGQKGERLKLMELFGILYTTNLLQNSRLARDYLTWILCICCKRNISVSCSSMYLGLGWIYLSFPFDWFMNTSCHNKVVMGGLIL